mmetsp:Transcript_66178/g.158294  ORF Transcript_66178/g.158294 Transcript_66178/m.158294 type:complete len:303 (+) Transcript_66178:109-1017(+)
MQSTGGLDAMEQEDPYEWEVRAASTPFAHHALAGSCAGIMEHVGMYPIDTVKTQMQAAARERIGAFQAARTVLQENSVGGLMRGACVIGAGCVPAHVGLFGTYEFAMAHFGSKEGPDQHLRTAACGAAAATVHDCILTPYDLVKQRLQLGLHRSAWHCITSIYGSEGLAGFYRSLPITLAMNAPYTGLLVMANEALQGLVSQSDGMGQLNSMAVYFGCAGVSGGFAACLTSPLDVVKTRIQTCHCGQAKDGCIPMFLKIAREEGARGFFRGVGPRVCLAVPSAAMCWGTYETLRQALIRWLE